MRHPIDLPKLYLDLEFAQSHSNDAVLYMAPLAAPTHHITAPAQLHATDAGLCTWPCLLELDQRTNGPINLTDGQSLL